MSGNNQIENAFSLRIANAPTGADNNYALWVDDGVSRFDGNVGIGETVPLGKLHVKTFKILHSLSESLKSESVFSYYCYQKDVDSKVIFQKTIFRKNNFSKNNFWKKQFFASKNIIF